MTRKIKLYHFWLGVFGIVFLFSAYMVYDIAAKGYKEQQAFDELAKAAQLFAEDVADATPPKERQRSSAPIFSYDILKKWNPDFFGWILIEGTKVNYPVMHTPDDEEYYLRRDFEREQSRSGVPFLAASCYEGCGNYLIYGHNMNNGAMFASLLSYAEQDYWEQHPVVRFDTLTTAGEYNVLAAFYSEAYPQNADGVFRFYQYTDLTEPSIFAEYVEQVKAAALYDTGINAEYGDEIITLSTCSYHSKNGRFVVVACKAK